jgi:hypothetical protein
MRPREQGSAVITVVLVVLVLTMVGIASMLYMSLEQNLTLADRLSKEALYMSETGMRQGETILAATAFSNINTLLSFNSYPSTSNNWSQIPASMSNCEGTASLGAILKDLNSGTVYKGTKPSYYNAPAGYFAVYNLYVRNNPDDPSLSPTTDSDRRVRLICVGEVYKGKAPVGGIVPAGSVLVARKIIEEELSTGVVPGYSTQKQGSSSGAGSAFYK